MVRSFHDTVRSLFGPAFVPQQPTGLASPMKQSLPNPDSSSRKLKSGILVMISSTGLYFRPSPLALWDGNLALILFGST